MSSSSSKLDAIYRRLLLTRFFTQGWGQPEHMRRIFAFRRQLARRSEALSKVEPNYPMQLSRVRTYPDHRIVEGRFLSPCAQHLPELLPSESHWAHFQMILPVPERVVGSSVPMVIQYAGTGDHYFWRRRTLMAVPMARERGVGSIILENAFYGLRKPRAQLRSSLRNVTDLFVMGTANILETLVLLQLCQKEGFWPLVAHGISMGGHMAALSATVVPQPIGVVPCLALTSASPTFTQGVMARAIPWKLLIKQYDAFPPSYREEISRILCSEESAFQAGIEFAKKERVEELESPQMDPAARRTMRAIFGRLQLPFMGLWSSTSQAQLSADDQLRRETVQFMRGIMDECTHLKNFDVPVDPSLCLVVSADMDAYQPADSVTALPEIWPGAGMRRLASSGHISSYLFKQNVFREAIYEIIDKVQAKYPSAPPPTHWERQSGPDNERSSPSP